MNVFERLCFTVEWYQEEASLTRIFTLNYFPYDKSVEMFDRQKNKMFLKRVTVPDLSERNLYIGAKLNIFGRQVVITACEDEYTKKKLDSQRQKALGLIPSKYLPKLSEIMKIICENDLSICNCAMYQLSREQSCDLTQTLGFGINDIWSSGPMVALVITGCDAYQRLKQLVAGPERLMHNNNAISVIFGSGAVTDAVFYPSCIEDIPKMCDYFFSGSSSKRFHLCRSLECSTLCLIKPHAVLEGKSGAILCDITSNGFVIKAMKMFNLLRKNCEEFYEVYNGVSPDYLQMVSELSSGPFIAVEIGSSNANESPFNAFRQLCGPFDPEIAREIRPKTLRAKFGVNTVKNAVHCTDLEEDCLHEVEYFFEILS